MLWPAPETELFDVCTPLGISHVVWSPLAQGVLTGKYRPGQQPPGGSRRDREGARRRARQPADARARRARRRHASLRLTRPRVPTADRSRGRPRPTASFTTALDEERSLRPARLTTATRHERERYSRVAVRSAPGF